MKWLHVTLADDEPFHVRTNEVAAVLGKPDASARIILRGTDEVYDVLESVDEVLDVVDP